MVLTVIYYGIAGAGFAVGPLQTIIEGHTRSICGHDEHKMQTLKYLNAFISSKCSLHQPLQLNTMMR